MWQRFTENARKIIYLAQQEAGNLGDNEVNTGHMLLGLMRAPESNAVEILKRMEIDLDQVEQEVRKTLLSREGSPDNMALTDRAKRSIDLAYDESRTLNDNFLGSEHLLLGLIREEAGAGRVLLRLGLNPERIRAAVRELRNRSDN